MSNRIDRSLGVKPYSNHDRKLPIKPRWSLKATTVIKYVLFVLFVSGCIYVLHQTNPCGPEVRCAD